MKREKQSTNIEGLRALTPPPTMTHLKDAPRADVFTVENDGMLRKDGTPVLREAPQGQIVEKKVEHETMSCPECGSDGRRMPDGVVCEDPECAVVISDDGELSYEEFEQKTHNAATTMGQSISGTSASKPGAK